MSGPIVRKYGFPNHEQIFGHRPPEHGAEEPRKDEPKPTAKAGGESDQPEPKPTAGNDQRGA